MPASGQIRVSLADRHHFYSIDVEGDARAGPGVIEGFVSAQPGDRNIILLLNHLTGPAVGGD